ncbi:MAG: hypothetical protein FK734_03175 [Asgard group archaeon]|nr:hypothetical protein [Asgard group archaeon]
MFEIKPELSFLENSLWDRMTKRLTFFRYYSIFSIVPMLLVVASFLVVNFVSSTEIIYVVLIVSLIICFVGVIVSLVISFLSVFYYKNYNLIESMIIARNVNQLIIISEISSFQERGSYKLRELAIAGLAKLAAEPAIKSLTSLSTPSKSTIQALAHEAISEIQSRLNYYATNGLIPDADLPPYQDNQGNFISLFDIEKRAYRLAMQNYSIYIAFIAILYPIFSFGTNSMSITGFNYESSTGIILAFGCAIILLEVSIILIILITRFNKIKALRDANDQYGLLALATKSTFGFHRIIINIALAAIGDVGGQEVVSSLANLTTHKNKEVQRAAVVALDKIAVRNNLGKRYALDIR